ncbi:unnamed protein product, partial [Symbiodinium pilosum]
MRVPYLLVPDLDRRTALGLGALLRLVRRGELSYRAFDQLSEEEEDVQNGQPTCKEPGEGELKLQRRLDRHVTGLAMSLPGYDLEEGPPVKYISVHHTGRFAFAEIHGSQ